MQYLIQGISIAVTVSVVSLFMNYVMKSRFQKPPTIEGRTRLVFGKFYLYIAVVQIVMGSLIGFVGGVYGSGADVYGWLGIMAFFYVLSIPLFLVSAKSITYDEDSIQQKTLFGSVTLKWIDIKVVQGRVLNQDILLSDGKKKIKVDVQVIGFDTFLAFLKTKVSSSTYEQVEASVSKMRDRKRMLAYQRTK